ncbi:MAG: hypothetical protein K2N22_05945 [Clostridia bacterium]|nr:hypothetical protein [Clostridia bacterium]
MEKGKIKFEFNAKTIKKRILPVILVSVLTPLILFVAIPFEVYANNMDELLFSLSAFFPYCVLFGFLLAAGVACALLFLPEKIYRICYALILALSFLFFMQGTFLNFGANSLAGDNLGTNSVHIGLKILDLFIWIAVLGVAVALAIIKDKKGIFAIVAVILAIVVVATQIITPMASTVKHPDVFLSKQEQLEKDDGDYKNEVLSCQNLTSVSSERNIFYFCIDKFDEYFAEVANDKAYKLYDNLDGFTWFQDNISLYGHTFPAVAHMLTENEYDIGQSRAPYLDNVYKENRTLNVLAENGYSINLYTVPYYAYNKANALPDNIENISEAKLFKTTHPMELVGYMIKLSVYRCLPHFLKDSIYGVKTNDFNLCVTSVGKNGYAGYLTDNATVYKQVSDAAFTTREGKNFSFIHIDGCHELSVDYFTKKVTAKQKNEITSAVSYSFSVVNEYIRVLKEKGLYENATIIITGDHPVTVLSRTSLKGAKRTALFFKKSGDAGTPLVQSDAPVAHENIWPTIMESEGIERENNGVTLYEVPENNERRHVWHTYFSNKCDEYVYKITGSGKNFDNWELIEQNYYDHCYWE